MKITVIGHGYVGLVTASVFASFGNQVSVIGRTPSKLERLNNGDPIIYEPGLEELLKDNLSAGRINFTQSYDSISDSQIVFIAVGTPPGEDGEADLSSVFTVAEKIGQNLKNDYTVVSCKSTVPVGTNLKVKEIVNQNKPKNVKFDVASCPEFLREGTGISDTMHPDRVVIGAETKKAADVLLELHQPIAGTRVVTDLASAELIKYAANSMLATKISFANLISFYCEETGADVEQVMNGIGLDERIGRRFLYPGIGFGGACFPKDVRALSHTGQELGVDTGLLDEVKQINFHAKELFLQKILSNFKGKKLAVWGLSFKPNTDDIREAPSRYILNKLIEQGFEVTVYDSQAQGHIKNIFGDKLKYAQDPYQAVENAEALVIHTEWNEFKQIDLDKVKKLLKNPIIFDGRNIYQPQKMKELGFEYHSVGRKSVKGQ
jgi:UDPglucose 6-dehydrogenase